MSALLTVAESVAARPETKRVILEPIPSGRPFELYGSTEAGWVTVLRPEERLTHTGSVGREWAGSGAIKLLDIDGREVPDGEACAMVLGMSVRRGDGWRQ